MDVVEALSTAWTVMEHARTTKRWQDDDLDYIKLAQDGVIESLGHLIGHEKTMKIIANDRIALRKWQEERQEERKQRKLEESDSNISAPATIDSAVTHGT